MSVRNKRLELLAATVNSAATSAIAVGIIAPLAAALYGVGAPDGPKAASIATGFVVWIAAACALHSAARWILGGLDE